MLQFDSPNFLWLLLLLPVWGVWFWFRGFRNEFHFAYGSEKAVSGVKPGFWVIVRYLLNPMKLIGIALLIIALARPQEVNTERVINSEGIDIMLALDLSGSMRAQDLLPNRLAAAKEVATDFVKGRVADRIGIVVYAGEAYTQCPLTLDYDMIKRVLGSLVFDESNPGTAIGMGIASSLNRLRDSEAKSKIIILLTDGQNNSGDIDPLTAADLAISLGIKIYTIGVGTRGEAPVPAIDAFGRQVLVRQKVDVDDETLTKVADMTGGKYFRATDNESLKKIYAEISELEKTKVEIKQYYQYEEKYFPFLLAGVIILLLEFLLGKTRARISVSDLGTELK